MFSFPRNKIFARLTVEKCARYFASALTVEEIQEDTAFSQHRSPVATDSINRIGVDFTYSGRMSRTLLAKTPPDFKSYNINQIQT